MPWPWCLLTAKKNSKSCIIINFPPHSFSYFPFPLIHLCNLFPSLLCNFISYVYFWEEPKKGGKGNNGREGKRKKERYKSRERSLFWIILMRFFIIELYNGFYLTLYICDYKINVLNFSYVSNTMFVFFILHIVIHVFVASSSVNNLHSIFPLWYIWKLQS